jgi:hypothetical protein
MGANATAEPLVIAKIVLELFPLALGVCYALLHLKQGRKTRIAVLIRTSIASGIFWAISAGELVGPTGIALEAVVFDCSAFLIGSISIWFIFHECMT